MNLSRREILSIGSSLAATTWLTGTGFAQAFPKTSPSRRALKAPLAYVNPEFRPALEALVKEAQFPKVLNASTLKQVRALMNPTVLAPALPSPPIQEKMIPGHKGSPRVRVFVVGAEPGASKPAIVHIHGGGYVSGAAGTDKPHLQEVSRRHDCVVVSVDYRLASETIFPGSLEDNYSALRWIFKNAKELGVDTKRVAIKGESAGGGHAAELAIAARDRGEFPICFQVLLYPMLDDRTGSTRRLPPYLGHFIWTEQMNRFGWSSLLGVPAGSVKVPPDAVPARVCDVRGLPPVFIGVGSIDLFGPEDIKYASRLMLAGISTELHVVPGAFHAFDMIVPEAPLSRQFTQAWNAALSLAFATS